MTKGKFEGDEQGGDRTRRLQPVEGEVQPLCIEVHVESHGGGQALVVPQALSGGEQVGTAQCGEDGLGPRSVEHIVTAGARSRS